MVSDDLSRFRWHTGARLRPVDEGEQLSVLFRDVGPVALQTFLSQGLERLAGPQTPLLYMRTAAFKEPFVDYAGTGRLVFLRPREVRPWHSGVPHVYVARADRVPAASTLGYVPGDVDFEALTRCAPTTRAELREHLGGREYDQRTLHDEAALGRLNAAAERSERRARPLRSALQSQDLDRRRHAARLMDDAGLDDQALCAAWHHLSEATRAHVDAALARMDLSSLEGRR